MGKMSRQFALSAVLIAAGYIALEHKTAISDLYRAAYPDDPVKREALDECSRGIPNFNRLDPAARENCYANFSGRIAVALPYNPSHLPLNDIRRQEGFDGYRSAQGAFNVSIIPPPSR